MKGTLCERSTCESQRKAITYKGSKRRILIYSKVRINVSYHISHNIIGYITGHMAIS